eukprot:2100911-Pyramimonas_sp.AAC.1
MQGVHRDRSLLARQGHLVREEYAEPSATMAKHWRAMGQCQDDRHIFLSCLADAYSPHGNVVAMFPPAKPTREGQASAPWHSQPSPLCLPCSTGQGISRSTERFRMTTNFG